MGFSAKQVMALKRNLNARQIRTREAHGRELAYIEGWFAIAEANRIFGFDGWDRETISVRCVWEGVRQGRYSCVYLAQVRIRYGREKRWSPATVTALVAGRERPRPRLRN